MFRNVLQLAWLLQIRQQNEIEEQWHRRRHPFTRFSPTEQTKMTAKLTQWYFAFIVLAFQLITFAHCQNWPVSVCYLQGACTCDNDLPEKATTVNCDCAKASATVIINHQYTILMALIAHYINWTIENRWKTCDLQWGKLHFHGC